VTTVPPEACLTGRFRLSRNRQNNALIASNAGVLIDGCEIAKSLVDAVHFTWMCSRHFGQ
jgi:hypothetical protein